MSTKRKRWGTSACRSAWLTPHGSRFVTAAGMDEARERVLAAAENVPGEGASDGDDVDATGSAMQSMRTRLLL